PPGIPLIMPGERFTPQTRSIVDYLRFARAFAERFPGFDADVHCLQKEQATTGTLYTVDCVREA
ncbi:MAG: Orn/Lys/Arg family decarboxylase, partial [Pseudomonadaceae bacterium]